MRDVVTGFYINVLERLIASGDISVSDSILVVCGGPLDAKVLSAVGFTDVTVTNLDDGMANHRQDVENLTYENGQFDVVVVHAGLHHCYSPHRALLEMYRVARKCALAFEARDSLLMRIAVRLGFTQDYEFDSIENGRGGVADTGTPNYIYRWTEREIIKTIASFSTPTHPDTRFFYEMRIPIQRLAKSSGWALRAIAHTIEPFSRLLSLLAPKQCNEFAFAVFKGRCLR
ncbi:methyltransferase domain-containing protein [Bradyrhizobium sp. CCGB01]|uniref:methyltransferase domain-containing protein n=1 Tax=Bradyrhizobium sp. CCGB01 TaxID=2949634 RepID=UPI0020B22344|nr:methyltransferase domain-containing protein [Bradyrhizobium sp. CCGB01]MCP3409928.1 class I SAM-dependent methyltransferase [Bradyrhizobium sp. CCGB01]